jgi:hypothetical protein
MKKSLLSFIATGTILAGTLAGIATPSAAGSDSAAAQPQIDAIRKATARFSDVKVALAEGYIPDPAGHCVSAAMEGLPAELGAMGIHYLRPDLLGITATAPRVDGTGTHTDFLKPSILLYEPQKDGSLVLVGVENLVFEKAWKAAGNASPPVLAGRVFDRMADDPATPIDEAHGFEPHYDQHVWFRENPSGNLSPFNPAVSCADHTH